MGLIISVINTIVSILILVIIIYVILGYFLSPYHPVRLTLSSFVEPMLKPIRGLVPPINGIDFSPLILIILLRIISILLTSILRSLG